MTNPFMAALGGGQGPMSNFAQMVQQFNQFKANFKGEYRKACLILLAHDAGRAKVNS